MVLKPYKVRVKGRKRWTTVWANSEKEAVLKHGVMTERKKNPASKFVTW